MSPVLKYEKCWIKDIHIEIIAELRKISTGKHIHRFFEGASFMHVNKRSFNLQTQGEGHSGLPALL